jgi:plasmid stabilization system protein ParE
VAQYRVELSEPAKLEIAEAQDWIDADSSTAAERWIERFYDALDGLKTMPARCPFAPENNDHVEEIRQLIYGRYRVLFTIFPGRVLVLHVRHGARLPLRPE